MAPVHRSYTVSEKVDVIKWHKSNGENISKTSRELHIDRKRIREWVKNEELLKFFNVGPTEKMKRINGGREAKNSELDLALFEYLKEMREYDIAVSNEMLQKRALQSASELGIKDFKASNGFLWRLKRRFHSHDTIDSGIHRETNDSVPLTADCDGKLNYNNGQICPEDNKPLTSEDIFPDNRTRREIMQMKVKCPNHEKGCDKIITIGQVKDHLTECNYEKIICPNACGIMLNHQHVIFHCDNDCDRRLVQCSLCDEKHPLCELELHQEVSCTMVTVNCKYCSRKLKRGELQAHVDKTCPKAVVTCCFSAFGCNQMLERDSLLAHVEEKRDLHDQCLCETVHKLVAKSITSSQVISSRRNSAEPSTSVTYPYMTPNMIAKAAEQITEQNQQEKHNEGVSHYIQELFTRVVDLEQRDREMDIELKQMKRNMQKRDEELKGRFCNGVYVWTINNFFALKSEAMNGNPRVVHSAPFYTSPRGYKVCLRLNVHIVKDHHDDPIIALFMHLMKGEYDDDLHWPFHGKISLSLLNANNVDANIAHDMASVPELSAFKRPTSNRNLRGFGYSEFSTVSKLESENFINDDKLSIKASIVSFKE